MSIYDVMWLPAWFILRVPTFATKKSNIYTEIWKTLFYNFARSSETNMFRVMIFNLWSAENDFTTIAFKQKSAAQKYTYGWVQQWFSYR